MTPETEQQYKNQIAALQAEIEKLKNQQTKAIQREKYGLNWIDVPEEFDEKSKNSIPVLKEIKEKAIKNDDGKPTHILIEGDNYHALTCLNYTHAGKIDVIYIDPPYNTGSDGFTYKDARFMTEFPNGKTVPKDDPLRHSTWLSFMEKRLRLAKNLLSDKGVIFISIDDNEYVNLKLLCDQILGEKNFISNLIWKCRSSLYYTEPLISDITEYILVYAKKKSNFWLKAFDKDNIGDEKKLEGFFFKRVKKKYDSESYSNPDNDPNGPFITSGKVRDDGRPSYTVTSPTGVKHTQPWVYTPEVFEKLNKAGQIYWGTDGSAQPRKKSYFKDFIGNVSSNFLCDEFIRKEDNKGNLKKEKYFEIGTTESGTKELKSIFDSGVFSYPKPTSLIRYLIFLYPTKNATILDFFAGSGTTLHATMKLNAEDGGNRQCILVQQKENDANICETITYERNRRVMQGYTNAKGEEISGLGNSLKYYKTDFIGENDAEKAGDEDKITLAQKAGYLISLVENTLEEIETNDFYQIFSDAEENQFTAIYFNGDTEKFPDFVQSIQDKNKKTTVYIFTWGSPDIFENEFDDLSSITIKSIPQPILEIYKSLMKNEE